LHTHKNGLLSDRRAGQSKAGIRLQQPGPSHIRPRHLSHWQAHSPCPGRPVSPRIQSALPSAFCLTPMHLVLTHRASQIISRRYATTSVRSCAVFVADYNIYSGHVATVFGATGQLGRYIVNRLGTDRLSCSVCQLDPWTDPATFYSTTGMPGRRPLP
jgi:hypothetical protein